MLPLFIDPLYASGIRSQGTGRHYPAHLAALAEVKQFGGEYPVKNWLSVVLVGYLWLVSAQIQADADTIRVGSIHDTSGILGHYGRSMDKAVTLAIEEINAAGGLLGRSLKKVAFDTRSDPALYPEYASQLIAEQVDVVHGAILSSDREAIRQVMAAAEVPYFYNRQYEGGVCDRNAFFTGVTPAQQAQILMPEVIRRWGKNIVVVAADNNYGRITAKWIRHFAKKHDGKVLDSQFFDLAESDFNTAIKSIRQLKPDMVVSLLIGGPHLSFYRQWAASGAAGKIPVASTTMGAGNEHLALTKDEGDGIMMVYSYSKALDTTANREFVQRWSRRFGDTQDLHELAVSTYQGVHVWAEGVRRAGTLDSDRVIEELEGDLAIDAPTGKFSIDPLTHHAITTVHLVEVKDQAMRVIETFGELAPRDTQIVCNLALNPNDNEQYAISVELYDVLFPQMR